MIIHFINYKNKVEIRRYQNDNMSKHGENKLIFNNLTLPYLKFFSTVDYDYK